MYFKQFYSVVSTNKHFTIYINNAIQVYHMQQTQHMSFCQISSLITSLAVIILFALFHEVFFFHLQIIVRQVF